MIVTVSNRTVALIKQLEGLDDATTDSEILENVHRYGANLGRYLADFGVQMAGALRDTGEICDYQCNITSSDRETVIKGLQVLNPLNITVEFDDLPKLVLNGPM